MRRRDFLKGLAAVVGVASMPAVASPQKGPYDEQVARFLKAAPPMDIETLWDVGGASEFILVGREWYWEFQRRLA